MRKVELDTGLHACSTCGAATVDRHQHERWHRQLDNDLGKLGKLVRALSKPRYTGRDRPGRPPASSDREV